LIEVFFQPVNQLAAALLSCFCYQLFAQVGNILGEGMGYQPTPQKIALIQSQG